MAFGAQIIPPIDTKPSKAVGVAIPFNAPAVFFSTYTTKDATKNNLLNFFLTNTNERYLTPTFGGNLRQFVFQQITSNNLNFLEENIQSQLTEFFPNVNVQDLQIKASPDNNQVNIILKYNIVGTGLEDEIQITFT